MKIAAAISLCICLCLMKTIAQTPEELAAAWDKQHITNIFPSNVRHKDLKIYLETLKKSGIDVKEVGRSYAGREIYQMEFGKGPLKIFMWSQMHGDEPTATSALIDMFAFLQQNREKDWVKNLEKTMTIRAVPMLNPDGAEMYIRRNMQSIDINRDAQNLQTPEAQLLKKLRHDFSPAIGFNLHNQNALTTVGRSNRQAAVSLLVVYGDAARTTSEGHERNKRLCGVIIAALQKFIPGHIGRYDDGYTPNAFGDSFSAWGTPVILIETGALHGKDEMFLVKMNFVAFLSALKSLADSSEKTYSSANYEMLTSNGSGTLFYFIFRNATIIDRANPAQPITAAIAINKERRRSELTAPTFIRTIGDLKSFYGLEEYDVSGYFVAARFSQLKVGEFGELLFYRKGRVIDWKAPDLEKQFPPDAIFSLGKWLKGEEHFKKK